MGNTHSTRQKLGERVLAARAQLDAAKKMQRERLEQLDGDTLDVIVRSVGESFKSYTAFSESLLLVAFAANPEEVQRMLQKAVKQVLSASIRKAEYDWFRTYVFPSMVWMMQNKDGVFLYEAISATSS